MTAVLEALRGFLAASDGNRSRRAFVVAFSGGLDSTVLLHGMLLSTREYPGTMLRAIHVDHRLYQDSARWAAHCASACARFDVPFHSVTVDVVDRDESGPEAAARRARYAALSDLLEAHETLLTAHHREDQVETLLLNLARGAGIRGLAGIPSASQHRGLRVMRPLLEVSRESILDHASHYGLDWLEDPSNADVSLDRNFLRHRVLPLLRRRWPRFERSVMHSVQDLREAAAGLEKQAAADAALCARHGKIQRDAFRRLEGARRRRLVRFLCRQQGVVPPPRGRLQEGIRQLLQAGPDRQPVVRWSGGELRRHRDTIYLLGAMPRRPERRDDALLVAGGEALSLDGMAGTLRLRDDPAGGLDPALVQRGLRVRFRTGGERLRPRGGRHRRTLKALLREHGVVPWMRDRIPLLYAGDRLVAVGDTWLADDACVSGQRGYVPEWRDHPPLA